jgi:MOSC domain-containing protein YiiM
MLKQPAAAFICHRGLPGKKVSLKVLNSMKNPDPNLKGIVIALSISDRKGIKKTNVPGAIFVRDHGLEDDAHAGPGDRQVSLLAMESIEKIKETGLEVNPGDFAENITTQGVEIHTLPLGSRIKLPGGVELLLTRIGKECHERCAIYYQTGDCVMPREGIFCKVLKGGSVQVGVKLEIVLPTP